MAIFNRLTEAPSRRRGRRQKVARIVNYRVRNIDMLRAIMRDIQAVVIEEGNEDWDIRSVLRLEANDEDRSDETSVYTYGTAIVQTSVAEDGEDAFLLFVLRLSDHNDERDSNEEKRTIRRTLRVDDVIHWRTNNEHGIWDMAAINDDDRRKARREKLLCDSSLELTIHDDDVRMKIDDALDILRAAAREIS